MGMFDSVFVKCPNCSQEVEFQSKAGECILAHYRPNTVPIEIAYALHGETAVCRCGQAVRLELPFVVPRCVSMEVIRIE